jgi:hypothetical protein
MFVQVATASQFFISYTIRTFGALTFATIMTTRQVDTVLTSVMYFHLYLLNHLFTEIQQNVFTVGEYTPVLRLVRAPPQLDAVGWGCKSSVPFSLVIPYHFIVLISITIDTPC